MTNTHINVGGHKITTNKVGQVKTATNVSTASGTVQYVVANGICCLLLSNVTTTEGTGDWRNIATNIPKAKLGGLWILASGNQVRTNNTNVQVYKSNGNANYGMVSYPVADDWVES